MGFIHDDVRSFHLSTHSAEEEFLRPFLDGFEVTWGRRRKVRNTTVSVYFLRPETFMSEMFGFSQELLLVYSPYATLEPRTMQAAEHFISDDPGKGRVEKLTYFLVSEMPNPQEWARAYTASNQESRVAIALSASALRECHADAWYIRNRISEQLYSRDLFDFRLPLEKDTYFFGREDLLIDYLDAAKRGENRGIFGLRKTGKTSFLFKLARFLKDDGRRVHYYDCKSPSIRQLEWHELLGKVADDIASDLSTRFKRPADVRKYPEKFTALINRIPSESSVTLIFDEIEYISPFAVDDKHWRKDYVPLWQTFWAAQSLRRKMSVVVAGVNASLVEIDRIDEIQNPLFGIVSFKYLQGLGVDEVRRMVRILGRRMGLRFSETAVSYMFERYGGHPLLTRLACSFTHQKLMQAIAIRPVDLDSSILQENEVERDSELTFYCRHVVSELQDFYPDEYEMLELLAGGHAADFVELAVYPEQVRHLKDYGLLDDREVDVPRISIPVVARYVALEEARRAGRKTVLRLVPSGERANWLRRRIQGIIGDFDEIQRLAESNSRPALFGPNSFAESHRFATLPPVASHQDFVGFINTCNRCFIEAIESFGKHQGLSRYFWEEIKESYSSLWSALHRIKVYRHNQMHLRLDHAADESLRRFMNQDLEGREPSRVEDIWFILQQCVLDGLLNGLQVEITRLGR